MQILTRMCISVDGCVSTTDGRPVQLAESAFVPGQSHGFPEFQRSLSGVLMGRTTFEPALGSDRWPWPDLEVYVLGSRRPEATPEHVVVADDPADLLARMQAADPDGVIHLVGGPRTLQTFLDLGAVDQLGMIVLPLLLGDGLRLTASANVDRLTLRSQETLDAGAVELVYDT